jgi:DNA-binding MarR family transcriptional regulator
VSVTSSLKADFYITPEFRNFIESLNDLKTEIRRFGKTNTNAISYNRLRKNVDDLEESLRRHYLEWDALNQMLQTASERKLTDKQRAMLQIISEADGSQLYTTLIDRLSVEMGIPQSTVRWNLKGLRDVGLIQAGDRDNKGIPVRLTEKGRIMMRLVS